MIQEQVEFHRPLEVEARGEQEELAEHTHEAIVC